MEKGEEYEVKNASLIFSFLFAVKKIKLFTRPSRQKILSKIFTKTDNLRNLFSSVKLFVCLFVSSFLHKINQTLKADLTETINITLTSIKIEDLRCSISRSWFRKCSFKLTHILNLQCKNTSSITFFVQKSLIREL